MQHQNSVFHDLLKHVPWGEFERLVEAHGADARIRRLTTKSCSCVLYGQLSGASSLREITMGLESHQDRLYHLGASVPRRSTFADANALRPAAVFSELLERLMKQAHRGLRRALAETTYLIDSTGLRLNGLSGGWARFRAGVCGAKLHVVYDADADRPIYAAVTAATVNDITAAQAMPIQPGATYVFDLGYYDYTQGQNGSASSALLPSCQHPLVPNPPTPASPRVTKTGTPDGDPSRGPGTTDTASLHPSTSHPRPEVPSLQPMAINSSSMVNNPQKYPSSHIQIPPPTLLHPPSSMPTTQTLTHHPTLPIPTHPQTPHHPHTNPPPPKPPPTFRALDGTALEQFRLRAQQGFTAGGTAIEQADQFPVMLRSSRQREFLKRGVALLLVGQVAPQQRRRSAPAPPPTRAVHAR